ncbi:MAG: MBL fold metallo-hydrolase [Acidimicrobiales bacterium]|nr:MBL fold metallo-hydrolase [Acidimicrobiales bacterium]
MSEHHQHSDLDPEISQIGDGVIEIDTLLGGWRHVTAGYIIDSPNPILVETGSQTSVPTLMKALGNIGLGPNDLSGVIVTHIHLDHAGGVGDIAKAFPNATVYVHPKGARHLVDPTRLINSAELVYGPLLDGLYGRLLPTEAERIHVLEDNEVIEVGLNRTLTTIDSPGHAKHHLAILDSQSGLLFAGDAVGVRLPDVGILRPSSPPADFDLDMAVNSLRKFKACKPWRVALAHYGKVDIDPDELLSEAEETVVAWAEVAEAAWEEGKDIAQALSDRFTIDLSHVDPESRRRMETLNGVHSNAQGLKRWLETRNSQPSNETSG